MDRDFLCCGKCLEIIGKKSTKAARLWLDLCQASMQLGEIFPVKANFPELRVLEQLGYLISTDSPLHLAVKIMGHQIDDVGIDYFCTQEVHNE